MMQTYPGRKNVVSIFTHQKANTKENVRVNPLHTTPPVRKERISDEPENRSTLATADFDIRDNGPLVQGFTFPLKTRTEVERLEDAIHLDNNIRSQYINFLTKRKPKSTSVQHFLSHVFSDEALTAYNFHGSNTSGRAKIPMKTYSVFFDCFLEAYERHGLTDMELQSQLTAAIKYSRNRMRQRSFRARKNQLADSMPFWKKQIRELCKGFKFAQNPNIVEIRTIKQMLRSMDIRFFELQGINPRKPLTISGFPMPLQCEEDIERLELMVKRNPKIRQQYIEFLRCRKALSADISECFSNFFSDEAMVNYSWPMTDTCKMPRKQMNKYQIFTVCMLDIIIPDNSPNEVVGFRFPLSCPEDIERLEFAVQTDATVRAQYINFLATKKSPEEGVSKCFEHVFSHLSLYNYCLFKQEATDSGKKLMTEYDIFTECMLEAWRSHGLTKENLLYEQQLALDAALEHRKQSIYKRQQRSKTIQNMLRQLIPKSTK
ncbi:hypothetical protein ZHAS_00021565 [Anopheles sinensis]|uniref:DUF4806 domain-containing protein n=1 Tax=Anopheles sinensis TaxID=74873 RepID=A0A084WSR8_ANOSI|nr:hypothetical protein ZHAS_00021565 [Anopheles sinensis]